MKSNASLVYNCFLVVGDFLSLVLAFAASYVLRVSLDHHKVLHPISAENYIYAFLLILPFWLLLFALTGLYNNSIYENRFSEAGRLFMDSFIGILFIIGYSYAFNKTIFPAHLVALYGLILSYVLLLTFRNLARHVRKLLFTYSIGITNVLLVGNTKITHELISSLHNFRVSGYRIIGVVGPTKHSDDIYKSIPIFTSFIAATESLGSDNINSILQTELYSNEELNKQILEYAQTHHIGYRFTPGNSELFIGNIDVELFRSSLPVIEVHQTPLFGWGRVVKRLFDLFIGGIMLIIASPFMLILAILIILFGGRGGIFYRQTRLTRFNEEFRVYKFRTMRKKYSTGISPEEAFELMGKPELSKQYRDNGDFLPKDPRVTKLGRFMRTYSLDELPQLFNIIKGEISLVGPRALVPQELDSYGGKHAILSVKSGLTGLAQVSGRKDIGFEERRQLDIYYVQNWSFWLDCVILLKTVRVVLSSQGAK
jgi:exopolysaccharide biosynthesis polyprenyl glycosylphosphotransferase